MVMKCPQCSTENTSDSQFCKKCATPLPSQKEAFDTETFETPKEDLSTGFTFAGRYQIIEKLGKGGMGKVYRAFDKELKEEVALKLIKPEIASEGKTLERFSNELKFARKIIHKNVGRMFELMEDQGTRFITMEYVSGEDLKSFIRRSGRLGFPKALSIAKQVCEGLAEAHRLGIVHRDLKPSNIMIDKEGSARIMDFGIARSVEGKGITGEGAMIGTPEYMSPEQVEGLELDQRSDLYSLGIVLYEIVTGRVPFEGATPMSIVMKQKSETPGDPREINAQIPEKLSQVILKCLEKDREERYQEVSELYSDLINVEKFLSAPRREVHDRISEAVKKKEEKWQKSIAVLPFVDLSPEKDQEYFCDGMTEDIINKLSRFRELKVISRTSVMRYKQTDKDIKEIGRELGVATILEGSIRKERDNIRITSDLVNVEDGFHLWADTFDRKLASVFEVQEDVSKAIAEALELKLTPEKLDALKAGRAKDVNAYEYVLKGLHFIDSKYLILGKEKDFKSALQMFKRAEEVDPEYPLTFTGLAWAYQHHYQITGKKKDLDLVMKNGEKAYELDPNSVEANGAVGWVYYLRGEYDKAYERYKRALEINPNVPQVCHIIALFYRNFGLLPKAIEYSTKNIEVDPFYIPSHSLRARCLIYSGEFDKAEDCIMKTLEVEPVNFWSFQDYSLLYIMLKRIARAQEMLTRAEKINPGYPGLRFYKALIHASRGEREKAFSFAKNGVIFALLGMKDRAIEYISDEASKDFEHLQYSYLPLITSPFYDNLRDDERFKEVVGKLKKKYEERLKKYGKF